MAVDVGTLDAEELADQTLRWLRDELPAGWIDAVDADDAEALLAARAGLDYADWCVRLGEAGYATPTWPAT